MRPQLCWPREAVSGWNSHWRQLDPGLPNSRTVKDKLLLFKAKLFLLQLLQPTKASWISASAGFLGFLQFLKTDPNQNKRIYWKDIRELTKLKKKHDYQNMWRVWMENCLEYCSSRSKVTIFLGISIRCLSFWPSVQPPSILMCLLKMQKPIRENWLASGLVKYNPGFSYTFYKKNESILYFFFTIFIF